MNGYDHGDDRYRFPEHNIIADFSSNVPEIPPHEELWDAISMARNAIRRYPPPHPYGLEKSIAEKMGVSPECVAVTSGATEAIYIVAHRCQQSHSLVPQPTFSEYARAANLYNHKVSYCAIDELEELLSTSSLPYQVVWLCNPNNPTGKTYPHDRLLHWIEQFSDVLFVVDQSYHAFTLNKVLTPEEATSHPNCLLIQSLTKTYAIPGLRLGYLIAHPSLVQSISTYRMPWSVNALAIEGGAHLLRQEVPFSLPALLFERMHLVEKLQSLRGLQVVPTDTHYFLARLLHYEARELKERLVSEYGILVRDASTFPTLTTHHIRIATQSRAHNALLVEALTHILQ